jgi:hypothetical protein
LVIDTSNSKKNSIFHIALIVRGILECRLCTASFPEMHGG